MDGEPISYNLEPEVMNTNQLGELERIFEPGFSKETITTSSGKSLECIVDKTSIIISDTDNEQIHFKAFINADREMFLSLNVRNTSDTTNSNYHHPDLFPAKLLAKSIEYFDKQDPNNPVKAILANWEPYMNGGLNTNYKAYRDYIDRLGKDPSEITEADKNAAAFSTWTGQQALINGFAHIGEIEEYDDGNYVHVQFTRTP